jgi:hypothetical protein
MKRRKFTAQYKKSSFVLFQKEKIKNKLSFRLHPGSESMGSGVFRHFTG